MGTQSWRLETEVPKDTRLLRDQVVADASLLIFRSMDEPSPRHCKRHKQPSEMSTPKKSISYTGTGEESKLEIESQIGISESQNSNDPGSRPELPPRLLSLFPAFGPCPSYCCKALKRHQDHSNL